MAHDLRRPKRPPNAEPTHGDPGRQRAPAANGRLGVPTQGECFSRSRSNDFLALLPCFLYNNLSPRPRAPLIASGVVPTLRDACSRFIYLCVRKPKPLPHTLHANYMCDVSPSVTYDGYDTIHIIYMVVLLFAYRKLTYPLRKYKFPGPPHTTSRRPTQITVCRIFTCYERAGFPQTRIT